jgi:hypothetical protein
VITHTTTPRGFKLLPVATSSLDVGRESLTLEPAVEWLIRSNDMVTSI